MDFAKSDIQTMLLDSAERLLSETSGVEYWREQRHQSFGFDLARWNRFAELGWLALPAPEEAGGLNGTIEDVALLNIALGKALATEPYVSSVVLGGHVLGQAADAGQAEALLSDISTGALRVALAHQESAGDPLAVAVQTCASADGDGYILSGSKIFATDAASAGKLIVSAAMDGEEGIGLFLVDADTPGLDVQEYPLIDGTRAADIRLDRIRLPADTLLVGTDRGAEVLGQAIDRATIALMAQAVGAMEASAAICGNYAAERKQFGAPIGSFQAIKHLLSDNFVATHQARSMLYHALANADRGADERGSAISAARIVIGEAGQLVSRNGIQVHGGYGLTDEYAISHYFRRLMSLEKQYGDLAWHSERYGDSIFG